MPLLGGLLGQRMLVALAVSRSEGWGEMDAGEQPPVDDGTDVAVGSGSAAELAWRSGEVHGECDMGELRPLPRGATERVCGRTGVGLLLRLPSIGGDADGLVVRLLRG